MQIGVEIDAKTTTALLLDAEDSSSGMGRWSKSERIRPPVADTLEALCHALVVLLPIVEDLARSDVGFMVLAILILEPLVLFDDTASKGLKVGLEELAELACHSEETKGAVAGSSCSIPFTSTASAMVSAILLFPRAPSWRRVHKWKAVWIGRDL